MHVKPLHIVIPRDKHSISRKLLSKAAVKVLYTLKDAGFQSCLVGGGVRDILLGKRPKDFDIATNATPEQVKALFRNSRLIGRRFRLAHVFFGPEIIEVATFRSGGKNVERCTSSGMILRDNVYGSIEDDAIRRDFSINALYYDISNFTVLDFTDGFKDLKKKQLRLIGDPTERYIEDPVRVLRALRFVAKLDLTIEAKTKNALRPAIPLLHDVSPARLFEEVLKLFLGGYGVKSLQQLLDYEVLDSLFPWTTEAYGGVHGITESSIIWQALNNTDQRIKANQSVTPGFLIAALLYQPMKNRLDYLVGRGMSSYDAAYAASDWIFEKQVKLVSIPRRFSSMAKEIWVLQSRFTSMKGKRVTRLLGQRRFRAAYDFLLLRAIEEPELQEMADWWTQKQKESGVIEQQEFSEHRPKTRRRRRKPKVKPAET